jgi:hypothetical protein
MSGALALILAASLLGLIVGLCYLYASRKRAGRLVPAVLLVAMAVGVYHMTAPDSLETKGPVEETVAVMFCYFAMVLGMFAEYGYSQAEKGAKRLAFDPMEFLMPLFASPIVFIPLLTITTDISMGGAFTKSKLMVYLVAFQNGFFWKGFFEERRTKASGLRPEASGLSQP